MVQLARRDRRLTTRLYYKLVLLQYATLITPIHHSLSPPFAEKGHQNPLW